MNRIRRRRCATVQKPSCSEVAMKCPYCWRGDESTAVVWHSTKPCKAIYSELPKTISFAHDRLCDPPCSIFIFRCWSPCLPFLLCDSAWAASRAFTASPYFMTKLYIRIKGGLWPYFMTHIFIYIYYIYYIRWFIHVYPFKAAHSVALRGHAIGLRTGESPRRSREASGGIDALLGQQMARAWVKKCAMPCSAMVIHHLDSLSFLIIHYP